MNFLMTVMSGPHLKTGLKRSKLHEWSKVANLVNLITKLYMDLHIRSTVVIDWTLLIL